MLNEEGFWQRVTEAFGTSDIGEIASKLGRTYHAIYKWSAKERVPRLEPETLAAIADLTNISINWLLTGKGSRTVRPGARSEQVGEDVPIYLGDTERKIIRELASDSGRDYPSQVRQLVLESLKNRGLVADQPEPASLVFFGELAPKLTPLPLLGDISAGKPIQPIESSESVLVAEDFAMPGRKTFALRVRGDGMSSEGIWDGDFIICYEAAEAASGQFVVALIDDQATVRAFHREQDGVRLQPADQDSPPMFVEPERVKILGIVVGIQRRPGKW